MDWSNETWVRVYVRDTEDDLVLSWEARALWGEMMRKFDRSGTIDLKRGRRALANLVRMPFEVVDRAVPELVADGRVRELETGYFAPNFMTAQEAPASDKQRKKESREKRHAHATASPDKGSVTNRDQTSRHAVTKPDSSVTNRDALSGDAPRPSLLPNLTSDQGHTPVSDLGRPELPDPRPIVRADLGTGPIPSTPQVVVVAAAPMPAHARAGYQRPVRLPHEQRGRLAREAVQYVALKQQELKASGIDPTAPNVPLTHSTEDYGWNLLLDRLDELLGADPSTAKEILTRRLDVAIAEARRDRSLQYFTLPRMFEPKSFAIASAMSPEQAARPRAGPRASDSRGTRRDDENEEIRHIPTLKST